ncbi:hypothetical protein Tco_0728358 [Tanacetum coccineum]|uniref:Uncharacterized protein n=1 Tax=Tanacetum coccineum TaxID=301880 RepID=A0ABQ4YNK5_9ASTR
MSMHAMQKKYRCKGKTSADTEILLELEEPTELVEDPGSGEKGEKEISTAEVLVSTASAIPEKKTKKQLEQERLGHEEAIRLQEQEKSDLQKALELQKQLDEREEVIAEADPAQDVMDLHRLVKERYVTTSPEGYDLMLWGDLKTLFEPDEEDEVWRNQHGYNLISWRLIDSCGIHILLMDNGIAIHMMIYKITTSEVEECLEESSLTAKELKIYSLGSTNIAEQITANGDTVNTASIDVSVAGPSNEHQDKKTLVVIRDVEEELRRATPVPTVQSQDKGKGKMVEPEPTPKNSIKAQIQRDVEIAQRLLREKAIMEADALLAARLQEKERKQFSIDEQARFLVETITERKRFTYNQLKNKSFEEIQKLYEKEQKWIKYFIPMDSEEEKEKELLEEELQKLLVVVPVEEVYVEALQVKYPIIDWEVYSEDTRRDDLVKLWDFVKKRFSAKGGIQIGHDIFMLVEKEYPLTRGTLGLMMVARLLVEADSEMSRELLRKIFYQRQTKTKQEGLLGIKASQVSTAG